MNKNTRSKSGQVMLHQHNIDDQFPAESSPAQGILVPLNVPGFKILTQSLHSDGSIEVHMIATMNRAPCPGCKTVCVKIHDTRGRAKRDIALREYQVRLVISQRRFRCMACRRTFTETDSVCGRYKRTTKRFRDQLAKQACQRPVAHVAEQAEVEPRFVHECFVTLVEEQFAKEGRKVDETAKLPTPCFLGIDEFARRKGHHYDTILCDLGKRRVLEISDGRKLEEGQKLLERLDNPDAVKAVSMDMSASFRPAVQLCLPKAHIVVDHFHVMKACDESI